MVNEKEVKKNDYQTNLTKAIQRIDQLCPNEWDLVLHSIETQANQKQVLDTTADNIAARWAYAYSRINKILLRLKLIDTKGE